MSDYNSGRVPRPLRSTSSTSGLWQPPADGMCWRSAPYSEEDCAKKSRRHTFRGCAHSDGHPSGEPSRVLAPPRLSPSSNGRPETEPEPMEVGATRLSAAERSRRRQLGLCPYCGQEGYQLQRCPLHPNPGSTRAEGRPRDYPSPGVGVSIPSSSLSAKPFLVPISLAGCSSCVVSTALVDSSAVKNFIDQALAFSLNITSYPLSFPFQALDNRPLGSGTITHITAPLTITMGPLHQESLPFLLIEAPVHKVIHGLPWLQRHIPPSPCRGWRLLPVQTLLLDFHVY